MTVEVSFDPLFKRLEELGYRELADAIGESESNENDQTVAVQLSRIIALVECEKEIP